MPPSQSGYGNMLSFRPDILCRERATQSRTKGKREDRATPFVVRHVSFRGCIQKNQAA